MLLMLMTMITQASWGRSMPREYGVPKDRKLRNLSRGLFMESLKMVGEGATKAGLRCRLGCFYLCMETKFPRNFVDFHISNDQTFLQRGEGGALPVRAAG